MEYHKLKPALPQMSLKQRRITINAKVRTHIMYMMPLTISQPQYVRERIYRMMMKVNRWILRKNTFKMRNSKICKKIGMPLPEQEMLKCTLKFFHNLVATRNCPCLSELLRFPRRTSSRITHKYPKKTYFRTALEHMTELYNQQDSTLKSLSKPRLKRKLVKITIKYRRD